MLKKYWFNGAMLLPIFLTVHVAAQPSPEQLLSFVEKALASCNDVKSVTRDGSAFRVYSDTINVVPVYYEFDLDELNKTGIPINSYVVLQCRGLPCVSEYADLGNNWVRQRPSNLFGLTCYGIADKLTAVISEYAKSVAPAN